MNPYIIKEPTCISFSGGRTSAYMLKRIIDENNGLPDDAIVCFANTGKEMEETLKFVRDCEINWGVKIHWVEYQNNEKGYEIVNFETASRNGEPFEAIIKKRNYLPNPVTRFCTIELKIRTIGKLLVDLGIADKQSEAENMSWMGIRADEPRRVAKIQDKTRVPLAVDGITAKDVGKFWENQNFDLELPNMNGKTMHGNCDLCFLKGGNQIQSLIRENPDRAIWWAKMESTSLASKPSGAFFRSDRPSYQAMYENAQNQTTLDFADETISCFCGD